MTATYIPLPPAPLRVRLDGAALVRNWQTLARRSGSAACGAAVKANAYGLGAREVVRRLRDAGCRDFFVATWREAAEIADLVEGASLSVLHGVRDEDMAIARAGFARPVLVSVEQVARWLGGGAGGCCDLMVDTGMNRLGLRLDEVGGLALDELSITTLLSHLADADEASARNADQRAALLAASAHVAADRLSLANSAGVYLGEDYRFDLTRPGLALYGGVPRPEAAGEIAPVVTLEAQLVQVREVVPGDRVGYGGTWQARAAGRIGVLNLGYADGYLRAFGAGVGQATIDGACCSAVGRISMDLTAIALPDGCAAAEGDWVALGYDLPATSARSGLSQYELLTQLSRRADRIWA